MSEESVERTKNEEQAEWTGEADISKAEFLAVGAACKSIFWPTPGRKREPLAGQGSQQKGPFFAPGAPRRVIDGMERE